MKFCKMLFRDINFEPTAIQPCCNTHALQVPMYTYSGEDIDINDYEKFIRKIFNSLQYKTKICHGCPNLIDVDYTKDKLLQFFKISFDTVSLNMHRYLCNCRCEYCDYWHKQKLGYNILNPIKSLFEQKAISKNCMFSWGGGEPTIQPDFEEASAFIEEISPKQYIHTNAIKYSPAISSLLKNNHAQINISLDSGSEEIYRKIKGVDKYKQVINNIIKYRENSSSSAIHLKYIIYDKNNSITEIEKFLELASNILQITYVEYSFDFREVNRNSVNQKSIIAASFFENRSIKLGLTPVQFFIDNMYKEAIKKSIQI